MPLAGSLADYHLYALLAPHLHNHGAGNTAWVGDYKGTPMLFAEREGYALALASTAPWLARSVGFVGVSDGWQQLLRRGRLAETYARAENGNVALTGEIDLAASSGGIRDGARLWSDCHGGRSARADQPPRGLRRNAHRICRRVEGWHKGARSPLTPTGDVDARRSIHFSAAVLRVHESKSFGGGVIASLSIPWGFEKGDDDLGGYHLVWPRDLVETAGGFLAAGALDDARRVLHFLQVTQDADGHWCQNMWLDGSPYWDGIQMDEAALPVLLVDLACATARSSLPSATITGR